MVLFCASLVVVLLVFPHNIGSIIFHCSTVLFIFGQFFLKIFILLPAQVAECLGLQAVVRILTLKLSGVLTIFSVFFISPYNIRLHYKMLTIRFCIRSVPMPFGGWQINIPSSYLNWFDSLINYNRQSIAVLLVSSFWYSSENPISVGIKLFRIYWHICWPKVLQEPWTFSLILMYW